MPLSYCCNWFYNSIISLMITKTKQKELEKDFSGNDLIILLSYGNGEFAKNGMRANCRILAEKNGGSDSSYRSTYTRLKNYGAFDKHFLESKAKKYVQVSFRMSEELHKDLRAKSYKLNKSLNKLITQAVKRSLR